MKKTLRTKKHFQLLLEAPSPEDAPSSRFLAFESKATFFWGGDFLKSEQKMTDKSDWWLADWGVFLLKENNKWRLSLYAGVALE